MAIGSNLLATNEVAAILEVTESRVRQFVSEGRLEPETRIGINLLFAPKAVAEFAKRPRLTGRPKKTSENVQKPYCKDKRSR